MVRTEADLAPYTTLHLGGPARRLYEVVDEPELVRAVAAADARSEPLLVLGGGSNVVVADDGFPGTALAIRTRGIGVTRDTPSTVTLEVAAGEPWDDLVRLTVESGWAGLECLSGIPGLAGATPIQNVGAYGEELCDKVVRVRSYDRRRREVVTLSRSDCGFGYRTSRFKQQPGEHVILSVTFELPVSDRSAPIRYDELARSLDVSPGTHVDLAAARAAVLDLRRRKGMVVDPLDHDTWSVGSFFVNPVLPADAFARLGERVADRLGATVRPPAYPYDGVVKTSAAWLIERAGIPRGYGAGAARVSTKHTLALTHRGGGTTAELVRLAREIRDRVRVEFEVTLEPEPVFVGVTL